MKGKLRLAIDEAIKYAKICQLQDVHRGLMVLKSKLSVQEEKWNKGMLDYTTYSMSHARISDGILSWVDRLPAQPKPTRNGRKYWTLDRFRKFVLSSLLLSKGISICWLIYQYSTGGYNNDELQTTLSFLSVVLLIFFPVKFGSFSPSPEPEGTEFSPHYVNGSLIRFSYWLFPIYLIVIIYLIRAKAASIISFGLFSLCLGAAEAMLGGYLIKLLQALSWKKQ